MEEKIDFTAAESVALTRHERDLERLRRIVIKLAHRVTSCNKRIDDLLRANK